jgi:phosphoribosylformimino-5-aminoimidazole carboxamide ribotide isomerase
VRSLATIKKLLDSGFYRVVLGTKAVQDERFLKKALHDFKDRLIVSVDAKAGKLLIQGWQKAKAGFSAQDYVRKLQILGVKEIIYTDVSKDGTLQGPSIKEIKTLLKETGIKIIASGGVSALADIVRLKSLEKNGLTGIIIGKALYEGKFTLKEALRLA